jgi:YbbR domain-containing protein
MKSLRPGQIELRVDLKKAVEGVNEIPITQENIFLPPGISVNKADPPSIKITMDTRITKELAVQVDWIGRLPNDYILAEAKVEPNAVKVTGGSAILAKISTLYTEPVRLDNLQTSGSLTASLVLTPASLKLVSSSNDRVTIQYKLAERAHPEEEKTP